MYGEGKTRGQVTQIELSAACNQACAAILAQPEKVIPMFLKMVLLSNYEQTRREAVGGNQPNLNLSKVKSIVLLTPSILEQTEIVRRVEALFALADQIEQQSRAAAERVALLTQSVLAKAFRGELSAQWRCEHPDLISGDNSAAALLARIQAEREATGKKSRRA